MSPLPAAGAHLREVLGASRARLQRHAVLSQGVELALWHNAEDEVCYRQPGHHTLSVYLSGGRGSRLASAPERRGGAGQHCIFPPGHESQWQVLEPVQFLHLYLSELAWADRVVRLLDAEPRAHQLRPEIYGHVPLYHRWAVSLQGLDWQDGAARGQADALSQQVIDALVLACATPRRQQALVRPLGGLAPAVRRRVLERIEACLDQAVVPTLGELAAVACLSEYHFARMFRHSLGCSVHAWITERRLQRAQALLLRPRPPGLEAVAAATGWSHASHLVRAFRQHRGCTPGQWARWQGGAALSTLSAAAP